MPNKINQWRQSVDTTRQHVDANKHLYGTASLSKVMSKGTSELRGAEYVGRVFKNLGDVLHVKFSRLLHRFSEGEWVNNNTIRKDLGEKIEELTALVRTGNKMSQLSEKDKKLVQQGIAEMQAVCFLLKERGVKKIEAISAKLDGVFPSEETLPNASKKPISSRKGEG